MQIVLLEARTRHGENRLREAALRMPAWSGRWEVVEERELIPADPQRGPFLFLAPEGVSSRDRDWLSRWVNLHNDKHFHVRPNAEVKGGGA